MSVYYHDLILAGTSYRGPIFTQDSSGWADDIVYVPPSARIIPNTVISGAGYAAGVGTARGASPISEVDPIIALGARPNRMRIREQQRIAAEVEEAAEVMDIINMIRARTIH